MDINTKAQKEILNKLDFTSKATMLMATREDLEKWKTKNPELSERTINEMYSEFAGTMGLKFENWWEEVLNGIEKIKKFNTGIEAIDDCLKKGSELCSDELIELVGPSGGGKTTLALRIASRALFEKDAEIIYIDSTNYCNDENIKALLSLSLKSYEDSTQDTLYSKMSHFRTFKMYTLDELLLFLSTLISMCKKPTGSFIKPHIIVIDSLSSMASAYSKLEAMRYLKEALTLMKILNKKFYCMVMFTNNAYDGATKISELSRLVGEPFMVGVDKSIYCSKGREGINYMVINS